MNVWIDLAKKSPADDEHAHVRFVFYWIAYEAAYQSETHGSDIDGLGVRRTFHARLARHDRGRLRNILRETRRDAVDILELRQANPFFWKKVDFVSGPENWERRFGERVRRSRKRLDDAIDEYSRRGTHARVRDTLDDLFRNLNLVRNQIVHGGSAGPRSRGRTQVLLGARLLEAFVPCFRDSVASKPDEDWGILPFPRVGTRPDDTCPPPWLELRTGTKR